jgi:hypothetical protein
MRALAICLIATMPAAFARQPGAAKLALSNEIQQVEALTDRALRGYSIDNPIDPMTPTHGVYAEGFGVVFITDVNLTVISPLWGFGGVPSKEEINRIRESKLRKLPGFKDFMTTLLINAATRLDQLKPDESILLHVRFYYMEKMEDRSGLPTFLTVQAKRQDLLDAADGKIQRAALIGLLKTKSE